MDATLSEMAIETNLKQFLLVLSISWDAARLQNFYQSSRVDKEPTF